MDQKHGDERNLQESGEDMRVFNMLYKGKNKDSKIILWSVLGKQVWIDTEHCSVRSHGKLSLQKNKGKGNKDPSENHSNAAEG